MGKFSRYLSLGSLLWVYFCASHCRYVLADRWGMIFGFDAKVPNVQKPNIPQTPKIPVTKSIASDRNQSSSKMSEGLAKVWGFLEKMAPVQQHHIPHAPEKPVAKSIAPGRELLPGKLWEGWSAIWAIAENVAHVQQHHIPQTLKKPVANSIASSSQQLLVREPKIDLRDYQSLSAGILISSDVLKEKLLKKEITEEKAQELKNLKVLTDKCEALVFSPEKFEKFMEKDGSPKGPKIDKNDSKRVLADREDHSGNASGLSKSPKKDGKVYPEPLGSSPEVLSNDFDYCCKKATKLFAVAVGKDEKRSIAKDLRLFIDNHRASGVRLVLEAWSHASSGELKIAKAKAEEAYKDLASAAELQISLSKYLETASQVSQVTESETLRNLINELRQTKEFFMPENSEGITKKLEVRLRALRKSRGEMLTVNQRKINPEIKEISKSSPTSTISGIIVNLVEAMKMEREVISSINENANDIKAGFKLSLAENCIREAKARLAILGDEEGAIRAIEADSKYMDESNKLLVAYRTFWGKSPMPGEELRRLEKQKKLWRSSSAPMK